MLHPTEKRDGLDILIPLQRFIIRVHSADKHRGLEVAPCYLPCGAEVLLGKLLALPECHPCTLDGGLLLLGICNVPCTVEGDFALSECRLQTCGEDA